MKPATAIEILVDYSRLISAGGVGPDEVLFRLADTVVDQSLVDAVVVVRVSESGDPRIAAERGVRMPQPLEVDGLGQELERVVLDQRPDCDHVYTLPLVSSGALYGAVVLLWDGLRPDDVGLKLVEALVDISAVGLDRAQQTSSLQAALDELEASQEALARKQKLEALGRMAAVVAHEVKNPLASVSGALQVLGSRMGSDSADGRVVEMLLERVTSLASMVDELLVFARPRQPTLRRIAVARVLDNAVQIVREDPRFSRITITQRVEPPDQSVLADPSLLQPVLLNLFINASQAMDGEGSIHVSGIAGPGRVEIAVHDSGPGVPLDKRARVFEPFFTTRTRGSGLGLAIAAQSCEAHGGSIRLDEEAEGGARFVITLPERNEIGNGHG